MDDQHRPLSDETSWDTMSNVDDMPIDEDTRERANRVLREANLTEAEAFAMLLRRVARDGAMPFERQPNAETIEAMEELDSGGGEVFATVEELLADARADD